MSIYKESRAPGEEKVAQDSEGNNNKIARAKKFIVEREFPKQQVFCSRRSEQIWHVEVIEIVPF